MSGHSKWATTKRKKAKTDVARAKAWNKLQMGHHQTQESQD